MACLPRCILHSAILDTYSKNINVNTWEVIVNVDETGRYEAVIVIFVRSVYPLLYQSFFRL